MDSKVDLLLRVLPVVFTALTALGAGYAYYIGARKKELADPASLEAWLSSLADSLRMARYHNAIKRALDRVDGFFGEKPFGWRALTTCWLIAYAYPLMLFMLTWAAGRPHTLGVLELLPASLHWALRWIFVMGFALYGYGLFLLLQHNNMVGAWLRKRRDRFFDRLLGWLPAKWRRPVGSPILGLLFGGFVYAGIGNFNLAGLATITVAMVLVEAKASAIVGGVVAVVIMVGFVVRSTFAKVFPSTFVFSVTDAEAFGVVFAVVTLVHVCEST